MRREGQEEGSCPGEWNQTAVYWNKSFLWLWVTFLPIHMFAATTSFVEDLSPLYAHQIVFHSPPIPSYLPSSTYRKRGYSPEPQVNLVLNMKLPAFVGQVPSSGMSSAWGGNTSFKGILPVAVPLRVIFMEKRREKSSSRVTLLERKQGWMLLVLCMFWAKAQ